MNGNERSEAGSDERHRIRQGVNSGVRLFDHPADGQRLEIRRVQIRAQERQARRRRTLSDESRLRRPGRRREAVEVDDASGAHSMCWQPGRH
jgi:hypothetical protein